MRSNDVTKRTKYDARYIPLVALFDGLFDSCSISLEQTQQVLFMLGLLNTASISQLLVFVLEQSQLRLGVLGSFVRLMQQRLELTAQFILSFSRGCLQSFFVHVTNHLGGIFDSFNVILDGFDLPKKVLHLLCFVAHLDIAFGSDSPGREISQSIIHNVYTIVSRERESSLEAVHAMRFLDQINRDYLRVKHE